jgi:endoglucanase
MKRTILLTTILATALFASAQDFVTRKGNKLTKGKDGNEILLRGICFGNQVWGDVEIPSGHHNEQDYRRVKEMGMNAIRFYMNYKTFEDDASPFVYKQTGWDWIDQNIAWAKKYNIYLILNIHIPQGGFQSQCKGDALWTTPSNQDRLVSLWKAIANHYKDEPIIAGFDLLNEPTPSVSVTRWKNLAQRIIDSVRTVDQNHLIITERAIALGCNYGFNDGNNNFQPLKEENLMYTVHMYDPFEFTHQLFDWGSPGDGGKYPDESILTVPSDATWAYGQYNNTTLASGTSDWRFIKGKPFLIDNDSVIIARPVFYAHRLGSGIAYYDDMVINEVTSTGAIIREIAKLNFTDKNNIYPWSEKNDMTFGTSTVGHGDNFSLTATGTTGYGSITVQSLQFKVEKGKYYSSSAWVKGDNLPNDIVVSPTMELYSSPSKQVVLSRNKQYLYNSIFNATKYPRENNFPIYYGEFGCGRPCFENDKGGDRWAKDVMDIFDSLGYNFTYHAYREDNFGLYGGWDGPMDTTTVQQTLKKTFEDFFGVTDPTGIENETNLIELGIQIFPNPAQHSVWVKNNSSQVSKIELLDMLGNIVLSKNLSVNSDIKLEIDNLKSGLYFCQIQQGEKRRVTKIVKE